MLARGTRGGRGSGLARRPPPGTPRSAARGAGGRDRAARRSARSRCRAAVWCPRHGRRHRRLRRPVRASARTSHRDLRSRGHPCARSQRGADLGVSSSAEGLEHRGPTRAGVQASIQTRPGGPLIAIGASRSSVESLDVTIPPMTQASLQPPPAVIAGHFSAGGSASPCSPRRRTRFRSWTESELLGAYSNAPAGMGTEPSGSIRFTGSL